jgi:hypothetical protein
MISPKGADKWVLPKQFAQNQLRCRATLLRHGRPVWNPAGMFLRHKTRHKDGKKHRYWSIFENRRVSGGRTVQRHVLYLGEIIDAQKAAWCQTIEAFDEGSRRARPIALFPEDRAAPPLDCDVVHVRLNELRLCRPRQWGACWLAGELWNQLQLDEFWSARSLPSRQGTRWLSVLKTLVAYRLTDPGSEWRLHRQWYQQTAMSELLGEDFGLARKDKLYRCLDKLVEHKAALFSFLQQRWRVEGAVPRRIRRSALRPHEHVFRIRAAGCRQTALRLQPRQTARLHAGGDCPGDHARRVPAGL